MIKYSYDIIRRHKQCEQKPKEFATVFQSVKGVTLLRISCELCRRACLGSKCTVAYDDETNEILLLNTPKDNVKISKTCGYNTTISIQSYIKAFEIPHIEVGRYECYIVDGTVHVKLNERCAQQYSRRINKAKSAITTKINKI